MIELGFDFADEMTKINFLEGFNVNSFNTFCDVKSIFVSRGLCSHFYSMIFQTHVLP